ncbi:hypothetical protein ABID99_002334 [Mucilaginibacter sp. OAE612]
MNMKLFEKSSGLNKKHLLKHDNDVLPLYNLRAQLRQTGISPCLLFEAIGELIGKENLAQFRGKGYDYQQSRKNCIWRQISKSCTDVAQGFFNVVINGIGRDTHLL